MSVEALQDYASPSLGIYQTIKAADQQLNQEQRLYTNVSTEATSSHGTKRPHRNSHHASVAEGFQDVRNTINDALKKGGGRHKANSRNRRSTSGDVELSTLRVEVDQLREENAAIRKEVAEIRALLQQLNVGGSKTSTPAAAPAPAKTEEKAADDDFDLFGSEDEEESAEAAKVREERLAAYAAKKAKKPGPIAKSSVILDVKPWDDETDLAEMERLVKSIEQDGLVWGATKQIPIGYGIKKLQIVSTIEDEKVSVDDLIEKIQDDFSDHVQSVDIVAFNKI